MSLGPVPTAGLTVNPLNGQISVSVGTRTEEETQGFRAGRTNYKPLYDRTHRIALELQTLLEKNGFTMYAMEILT